MATKTWSEAFAGYLTENSLEQQAVAFALKMAPSKVHYWAHGSKPYDAKVLARIERWSKGAVPASLPRGQPLRRSVPSASGCVTSPQR